MSTVFNYYIASLLGACGFGSAWELHFVHAIPNKQNEFKIPWPVYGRRFEKSQCVPFFVTLVPGGTVGLLNTSYCVSKRDAFSSSLSQVTWFWPSSSLWWQRLVSYHTVGKQVIWYTAIRSAKCWSFRHEPTLDNRLFTISEARDHRNGYKIGP